MQDLRLIGVHEDGLHLLLVSADGGRFSVPLDDALRAAARQDRPRLGQLQIEMDGGLRPRDVQAMIRAGASAEDVAGRAGWSIEKVRKYEGPIVAERVHVADLAREVRLRARGSGSGASGVSATLSARVTERMRARGVDPDTSTWDAWRLPETDHWTVSLTFAAGGRQRQAAWSFDPTSRVVDAQDDEARWLSEEEPAAGPLPGGPAGAGSVRAGAVYDVEAEGGVIGSRRPARVTPQTATPQTAEPHAAEPLDLMTAMRERSTVRGRRGARRKAPASSPTALPTETIPSSDTLLPGKTLRPSDEEGRTDALPISEVSFDPLADAPPPAAHTHPDDDPEVGSPGGDLQVTTADRTADATPLGDAAEDEAKDDAAEAPAAAAPRPAAPGRKGRPTVPSWDDIMFGGSRD